MSNYPKSTYCNNVISNLNSSLLTTGFVKEPTYSLKSSLEFPECYPLTSFAKTTTANSAYPSQYSPFTQCKCDLEFQKLKNQLTLTMNELNGKIDSLSSKEPFNSSSHKNLSSKDIIPYTDMMIKISEMQTQLNDLSNKLGNSTTQVGTLQNRLCNIEQQQTNTMNTLNTITNYSKPLTQNDIEYMINSRLSPIESKLNTLLAKVNEIDKQQNDLNVAFREIGSLARENSDHLKLLEIKCGNNSNLINENTIRVDTLIPSKAEKTDFLKFKNKQEQLNINYQSNLQTLHQTSDKLEEKIELVNQLGIKNARISQGNFNIIEDKINKESAYYDYNTKRNDDNIETFKQEFETFIGELKEWKEQIESRIDKIIGEYNDTNDNYNHEQIGMNFNYINATNALSNRMTEASENERILNSLDKKYAQKDEVESLKQNVMLIEQKLNLIKGQF